MPEKFPSNTQPPEEGKDVRQQKSEIETLADAVIDAARGANTYPGKRVVGQVLRERGIDSPELEAAVHSHIAGRGGKVAGKKRRSKEVGTGLPAKAPVPPGLRFTQGPHNRDPKRIQAGRSSLPPGDRD